MRKGKMISAALIIMLSTVIFGMSGNGGNVPVVPKKESVNATTKDNVPVTQSENTSQTNKSNTNETVKDQVGIDTGLSKEEFEIFKKEFYSRLEQNPVHNIEDRTFFLKINILELDKFKKLNIDFRRMLDDYSINDLIIRSELVIVGTYEDFQIEKDNYSKYPETLKIKVHDVISNETEYDAIPEYITIKGLSLGEIDIVKATDFWNKLIQKKEKYVFFLTRFGFFDYKRAIQEGKTTGYVSDDCFLPNVFSTIMNSTRILKNDKIRISNEKSVLDQDNLISIEDLKNSAKKIFEINNKNDFYKRNYK